MKITDEYREKIIGTLALEVLNQKPNNIEIYELIARVVDKAEVTTYHERARELLESLSQNDFKFAFEMFIEEEPAPANLEEIYRGMARLYLEQAVLSQCLNLQ